MFHSSLSQKPRCVHIRGPKKVLVQSGAVSKLSGDVVDRVKAIFCENSSQQITISKIALDADQTRQPVFVRLKVNIYDSVMLPEKSPFENSAPKAGTSCD